MKKTIVTGGAGFIGSHLVEELVRRDYSVTVIDDLSSGSVDNLSSLLSENKIELVQETITNLSVLQKLFTGVDCVFHQAAIGSVPRSVAYPEIFHDVNITGTFNVLLAARDNNVSKVVYASSSSVYGDTPTLPKKEDMIPEPLSPYAVTKLTGEYYCKVFQKVYNLPTVCLRYFNVYGPRQNPHSQYAAAIPLFIKNCRENNPPVIFGDGEQTRDFTFVYDVVQANILAAESDAAGVYNVSQGERITINRLVEYIIEKTGADVRPVYTQERPGDILHSLAEISRAKTFGYQPEFDLQTGLERTIRYYDEELQQSE